MATEHLLYDQVKSRHLAAVTPEITADIGVDILIGLPNGDEVQVHVADELRAKVRASVADSGVLEVRADGAVVRSYSPAGWAWFENWTAAPQPMVY